MTILELDQGNELWQTWRKAGLGSSDAATIMGASPYMTAEQLMNIKTGQVERDRKFNPKLNRGRDLEPLARALYSKLRKIDVRPVCVIHDSYDWLRASLDGLSFDNSRVLEIKCINKGDHLLALNNQVPPQYWPQVQHQLLVTGLRDLDYWSYSESTKFPMHERVALVQVQPDEGYMQELFEAELKFAREAGLTKG